jgi:hypothetical protein
MTGGTTNALRSTVGKAAKLTAYDNRTWQTDLFGKWRAGNDRQSAAESASMRQTEEAGT